MKFEDLTEEEIDIIRKFCEIHEEEFREFVLDCIAKSTLGDVINNEELAYDFCKPLLREQKISELLDNEI